jgi:hypothetical protein
MDGWQRVLAATGLLLVGGFALVGGTALAVIKALEVLTVFLLSLWAAGPSLFDLEPRPVPAFDFFWPALALLTGVLILLLGWVTIIRGATLAWPRRFDRSASDAS